MCRIDLKDAYFAVPIASHHQKYLRFSWKGQTFQFTCLPFGLSTAPRIFTKLLRPVVGLLRSRGVRCVIYLDDILILAQRKDMLLHQTAATLELLESLGFLMNYKKSHLLPTQVIFSWFHSGLNQETAQSPSREDEADKGGGQQASEARGSISTSSGMFHRETNSSNIGHLSSTPALQRSTAAETRCPQESRIRWYNAHLSEGSGGSRMVGQQPDRLEWQRPQQATTPDGSGDGCLQLRLGGIL